MAIACTSCVAPAGKGIASSNELRDSSPLKSMRTPDAHDGVLELLEGERALGADALIGNSKVVVVVVSSCLGDARSGCAGAGEPGACMSKFRAALVVHTVMDGFLEALVVGMLRVTGGQRQALIVVLLGLDTLLENILGHNDPGFVDVALGLAGEGGIVVGHVVVFVVLAMVAAALGLGQALGGRGVVDGLPLNVSEFVLQEAGIVVGVEGLPGGFLQASCHLRDASLEVLEMLGALLVEMIQAVGMAFPAPLVGILPVAEAGVDKVCIVTERQ